ncbi:MAG: nicotinate-nucleotide diphosphorylase (carboxylating), partial [Acidobacteriota bacterium]
MTQPDFDHPEILDAVRRALAEDIGPGDLTTNSTVAAGRQATGRFHARQDMVVAGVELLPVIYAELGGVDFLGLHVASGDRAADGDVLATVRGPARRMLTDERVSRTFMKRRSGVASYSGRLLEAV